MLREIIEDRLAIFKTDILGLTIIADTIYMAVFFKWFFLTLIGILLLGILFEQYSRRKLEKRIFVDRTFVEINGKPLHYVKKGEGNYTVVFQSGMGSSHAIWQEIQDNLSDEAVTISYDRNGIMFSEANGLPVTNEQVSEELQMLLKKTGCPKPYILVGHSMAGIYLRPFIYQNKADISGIVFTEAAHPKVKQHLSAELLKSLRLPPRWLIKSAVNTGLYRSLFSFVPLSAEIPMNHHLHVQERDYFYRTCDKVLEELDTENLNFKDAERYTSFDDIPLSVIMGTNDVRYAAIKNEVLRDEYRELLEKGQRDLLNLSTNSQLVKAENSGHLLQIHDAPLITSEIRKILRRAK